jgi:hypothetical protein
MIDSFQCDSYVYTETGQLQNRLYFVRLALRPIGGQLTHQVNLLPEKQPTKVLPSDPVFELVLRRKTKDDVGK